jgi:hypothetical protein
MADGTLGIISIQSGIVFRTLSAAAAHYSRPKWLLRINQVNWRLTTCGRKRVSVKTPKFIQCGLDLLFHDDDDDSNDEQQHRARS